MLQKIQSVPYQASIKYKIDGHGIFHRSTIDKNSLKKTRMPSKNYQDIVKKEPDLFQTKMNVFKSPTLVIIVKDALGEHDFESRAKFLTKNPFLYYGFPYFGLAKALQVDTPQKTYFWYVLHC